MPRFPPRLIFIPQTGATNMFAPQQRARDPFANVTLEWSDRSFRTLEGTYDTPERFAVVFFGRTKAGATNPATCLFAIVGFCPGW